MTRQPQDHEFQTHLGPLPIFRQAKYRLHADLSADFTVPHSTAADFADSADPERMESRSG